MSGPQCWPALDGQVAAWLGCTVQRPCDGLTVKMPLASALWRRVSLFGHLLRARKGRHRQVRHALRPADGHVLKHLPTKLPHDRLIAIALLQPSGSVALKGRC